MEGDFSSLRQLLVSAMLFSTSIKCSSEAFPVAGSSSDRCIMASKRSRLGEGRRGRGGGRRGRGRGRAQGEYGLGYDIITYLCNISNKFLFNEPFHQKRPASIKPMYI